MKATITGIHGFIGASLNKRLLKMGWETYSMMRPDVDYVFLFGSPSSDHWFQSALSYNLRETIENFFNAVDFCQKYNIKLIYPSSGTIYEGNTAYARCKLILEIIADLYGKTYKNLLGLRIFAGYGVGEEHKGEYASIVYKFCKAMKKGERPVIWGDGTQTRNFMYIDDITKMIICNLERTGYFDIGTSVSYSFNEIVKMINSQLGTDIEPVYIPRPDVYVLETICPNPCAHTVSIEAGIDYILKSL